MADGPVTFSKEECDEVRNKFQPIAAENEAKYHPDDVARIKSDDIYVSRFLSHQKQVQLTLDLVFYYLLSMDLRLCFCFSVSISLSPLFLSLFLSSIQCCKQNRVGQSNINPGTKR